MHQFQDLWTELNLRLIALREAFGESEKGKSSRANFEEFLEANEYEIAFHTLCDFLLEHEPVILTENLPNEVSELHAMMNLRDNCSEALKRKLNVRIPQCG